MSLTSASGWRPAKRVWNDIEGVHERAIADGLNGIPIGQSRLKGQYIGVLWYRKIVERRTFDCIEEEFADFLLSEIYR
ncbi:uncharacterized protein RSE6_05080 [Rhynchosporium secalis]|uniref:Uncharacterized protein n=1 Tax=Rhynchosporium secalis TaxID=38038 RepID=A0A1E1M6W9_RHYSE|nr:uncharacterized protein RSE6_05080 [Rhynchosporium secalis]